MKFWSDCVLEAYEGYYNFSLKSLLLLQFTSIFWVKFRRSNINNNLKLFFRNFASKGKNAKRPTKKSQRKLVKRKIICQKQHFEKKGSKLSVILLLRILTQKIDVNCRRSKLFSVQILKNYSNLHMPPEQSLIKILKKNALDYCWYCFSGNWLKKLM